METEEKKGPFKDRPTSDYLGIIEGYYTPETREKVNKKIQNKLTIVRDSIDDFVWGAEAKTKKEGGERKSLKKADFAEAGNLVHKVVIDHIKRALGEKAAKVYEESPELVENYVNSLLSPFGRNYKHLTDEIISLGAGGDLDGLINNSNSVLYRALSRMAENEVKEKKIYEKAKEILQYEKHKHHDNVIGWHHKKTGIKHKVSNDIDQIISDYELWVQGNEKYTKDFVNTQKERFHSKTHESYINTHYKDSAKPLEDKKIADFYKKAA